MTYRVPSQSRQLSQPNTSDVNGNIFATKNIDLDEEGYIKMSHGTVSVYGEPNDADFDDVQSMFHGALPYFLGGDLFRGALGVDMTMVNVTATDTTPPSPGPENDGAYFNGAEVVSDGATIRYNSSGTWTTIAGTNAPSGGNPVCMGIFPAQNSLLIGVNNTVQRYNSSWAEAQELTLPTSYIVLSIAVNGNYAYIGTRHKTNGEAVMFLWTGANTTNDGAYGVGTHGIQTIKAYGSSVVCFNSLGQLLRFSGSGFTELAALPVYYSRGNWAEALNDYNGITNRGMVVDGDLIYLLIDSAILDFRKGYLYNMPGGVWCYDPKVGLYHKHSLTSSAFETATISTAAINTTTNVITTSATVPPTGSLVYYKRFATIIGGLVTAQWYYVINVSSTTFKLAWTKADADAGTAIDLTSGSDTNSFYFLTQQDYGDVIPGIRGSIMVLNNTEYSPNQVGRIVFSGQPYNPTGTNTWRLCMPSPLVESRSTVTLPKMFAGSLEDTYNSLTVRFRPLKYGDKIIVKYRDHEKDGLPAVPPSTSVSDIQATWTSTTVFTTPASPSTEFYRLDNAEVGDEVEILSGSGAGHIAHISAISKVGLQYTVTLDEACSFVTASDKMIFQVNNWTKVETIDYTFEGSWKTIAIDTNSSWCQFRIEMRGTGVALEDNIIDHKPHSRPR